MIARYISIIIFLLSALSAFADKVMTVRNSDTGESFEVSVPDGLRIYEYNSNWLDSIPYLLERARYGEPWAYEALGDCYRYGKGGVERSIIKALVYYVMSGNNVDEMAINLAKDNPHDLFSLLFKLIDRMEAGDKVGIKGVIDSFNEEGYHDADVFRVFMGDASKEDLAELAKHNIMSSNVGTDEMIFTVIACNKIKDWPDAFENKEEILKEACNKFPYLYDQIGMQMFCHVQEDNESAEDNKKYSMAISFLEEADRRAFLSREGAAILYRHYKSEIEAGRMVAEDMEMERLAALARLPESDIFVFSDK